MNCDEGCLLPGPKIKKTDPCNGCAGLYGRPGSAIIPSELSDGLDACRQKKSILRGRLTEAAARCLTVLPLSEYADDWPKTMPKKALREIEEQTEKLKALAVELRNIADSI